MTYMGMKIRKIDKVDFTGNLVKIMIIETGEEKIVHSSFIKYN